MELKTCATMSRKICFYTSNGKKLFQKKKLYLKTVRTCFIFVCLNLNKLFKIQAMNTTQNTKTCKKPNKITLRQSSKGKNKFLYEIQIHN